MAISLTQGQAANNGDAAAPARAAIQGRRNTGTIGTCRKTGKFFRRNGIRSLQGDILRGATRNCRQIANRPSPRIVGLSAGNRLSFDLAATMMPAASGEFPANAYMTRASRLAFASLARSTQWKAALRMSNAERRRKTLNRV
jgi:hypothetical protein